MSERLDRVTRFLEVARRLADPADALGRRARQLLPDAVGLSREGVELALTRHLEVAARPAELEQLLARTPIAPRAHVLLSANVFVAPVRALAIALAASARVEVRPSRRDPELVTLLVEATRGAFRVVEELAPRPGDHVWAYGSDDTMAALRGDLPAGVVLHAHGSGLGVAIVEDDGRVSLEAAARALVADVVPFDQRGCLSPRVALFVGSATSATRFVDALVEGLRDAEARVPIGVVSKEELAEQRRYRDVVTVVSGMRRAGRAVVGFDLEGERLLVPPPGRNLHVVRTGAPTRLLAPLVPLIASFGHAGSALRAELQQALPAARYSALGEMQRPPLDGPVDLRAPFEGELL